MNILNLRNYGDFDNVKNDVKTLHDIIKRQGTNLLADCIAEHLGSVSQTYNLNIDESKRMLDCVLKELKEQTLERI